MSLFLKETLCDIFLFSQKIWKHCKLFEVLTKSSQYKNGNISNFVLAMPLEMNETDEVFYIEV